MDVVFDGQCGFCTRCVGWLKRLDRRDRLAFHPFQDPLTLDAFRLTHEDARSAVWALDGVVRLSGAAAIAAVLDTAVGTRLFGRGYRFPSVARPLEAAYRWVAAHRYRLPGATPWCTEHPQDCSAAVPGAGCAL
ncbi:thiol-disulfide oxidoreductase DCC family protein [Arthrobacter sp. NPDC090010]|uniref:thiol-disulfide oxidoreductase DCC family protein n=1 Tax=Arthrobacter sp. NPDC090010 TaxID=3363942 RepID=UPI0037FC8343